MVLAHNLAQRAAESGEGILCTLLLIFSVIATVLVGLALLGIGPWRRGNGVAFGPNHYGPVVAAVVGWVLYFILC